MEEKGKACQSHFCRAWAGRVSLQSRLQFLPKGSSVPRKLLLCWPQTSVSPFSQRGISGEIPVSWSVYSDSQKEGLNVSLEYFFSTAKMVTLPVVKWG